MSRQQHDRSGWDSRTPENPSKEHTLAHSITITEQHRLAAREEQEVKHEKNRMSGGDAARLRAIGAAERIECEAQQLFVERFARIPKNQQVMVKLLTRLGPQREYRCLSADCAVFRAPLLADPEYTDRRALKLLRCLAKGWQPSSTQDVLLFAELTPEEAALSDADFRLLMDPQPRRLRRVASPTQPRNRVPANDHSLAELRVRGIDCAGLDLADRLRIQKVGFRRWLDEITTGTSNLV